MSFNVGENVGPYRIVEQLGQGGMATVFKAYHASLDRYVALKALHPAFNQDKSFASRFQREARVVAKLEHPNIVPIYDYAEHETRPYLVMKFIEGDTLKARMDQSPLSADEISKIVEAVGSALAYAHQQGVLHRDVKPSNVLLANDGQIYLADFGLARMAQSGESTLSSDMVMGTPQYISPEQAMGKSDLDQRTDLYSFGVMLYEMVVGRVPFNADTPFAIIHDHIFSPLPLPRKVNPLVPESVERVLLKALAKERTDRFDDASQLVHAFKQAWNEAGVPMQGTFVRVSQALPPLEKTRLSQPGSVKTVAAADSARGEAQVEAAGAGLGGKRSEGEASRKKRSPLVWVGAALLLVLCLASLAYARNNRLFGRFLAGLSNRPAATATLSAPTQRPENTPPPITPPSLDVPLNVQAAKKRADDNPGDPNAQFELALAYWNAGLPRQSYETLGKVVSLAPPDDRGFYEQAGNKFKNQNEGWLPAAYLYFQAVRSFPSGADVPDHLTMSFHEALYRGADRPDVPLMFQFDRLAQVDPAMALIAQSRHTFSLGKEEEALRLLEDARRLAPGMLEAALLEGEFASRRGEKERAKAVLTPLVDNSASTPEWIRLYAQQLLYGIR